MSPATQNLAKRASALRQRMDASERSALAQDIGVVYNQSELSISERSLAEIIIKKLVEDKIIAVRVAIAEAVSGSPHLPGTIARKLAQDIAEVAIPVLELSPTMEEHFLEEIINKGIPEKVRAIAGRECVSSNLCRRIVASGQKPAVERLLNNPGAEITDYTLVTIVRIYGEDQKIEQAVLNRSDLPESVLDSLRLLTEAHVKAFIQRYFNLPEHIVDVKRGKDLLDRNTSERRTSNWWDSKSGAV